MSPGHLMNLKMFNVLITQTVSFIKYAQKIVLIMQ